MAYESEIAEQEGIISRLKSEITQTKLPARTINWQHSNLGQTRGITQRILIARKQRRQVRTKILSSQTKIMSFRRAILGE